MKQKNWLYEYQMCSRKTRIWYWNLVVHWSSEKTKISECETEKVVVEFGSEKIEIGMSKFRMGKLMSMNETECGKENDNIDENIKIKICL